MADIMTDTVGSRELGHSHVFLGTGHEQAERRTWAVIALCGAMMALEIGGGIAFGSIALVADGLHMSTHAGALLLAACAYSFARRHASDTRFTFGTGKMGDLAGFTSAIVLAMIALLIGYEAISRLFAPVPIHFGEAIPIAVLGLAVNVGSVWLLSGGHHHHGHSHGHGHSHSHGDHDHDDEHQLQTSQGALRLSVFEDGVPPKFRLQSESGRVVGAVTVETERQDGTRQSFAMVDRGTWLESVEEIPEPHAFTAHVHLTTSRGPETHGAVFEEHEHGGAATGRDNNMRAAIIHVMADAAVSVLVIAGLLLARAFGWLWMDPLAGIVGAGVIAAWAYGLVRDTGAILLDMVPDQDMAEKMRQAIETDGDRLADLHVWRLGPGHLGAIVSVVSQRPQESLVYRARLAKFRSLSHVTIEVQSHA